jgi:tRNA A-37 threonylcarbamoyl transferase component Bud32
MPHATLLVMERLPGEMLVTHLKGIETDSARLADIAAKVAGILRGLHQAKVAHRDLNAKNILVTPDNRVSLIDFDFATCYPFRGRAFRRRHARDLRTFFTHCGEDSVFSREVRRFLETGLQVRNHEIHERH